MNYILQEKAFWHKASIENNLKPTARLVYLALFHINNECGWKKCFQVTFGQVLSITGIANPKTYYSCLQELVTGGYIQWQKGPNQYQAASFELKVLYQNSEERGKSTVKAKSQHMEEQGKSKVNIPKPSNLKPSNSLPPLLTEVENYFLEVSSNKSEAAAFYDYYKSNGWKVGGKTPMKDWKAAARNWNRNQGKFPSRNIAKQDNTGFVAGAKPIGATNHNSL